MSLRCAAWLLLAVRCPAMVPADASLAGLLSLPVTGASLETEAMVLPEAFVHTGDPEPWVMDWKDLTYWISDHKSLDACEVSRLLLPVVLWLVLGSLAVHGLAYLFAPNGGNEAILAMSVFAVFVENLLYSCVFVDSLDFASSVFGDQSASGTIIGIHKMGTGIGTLLVFLLFTGVPNLWQSQGYNIFVGAFAVQVVAAAAFGSLSMLHVYTETGGNGYFAAIYASRWLQGLAGGVQVACGLEQSAFLKTGLQRSIQNTRFYLGGCLGMGFGPLLSSLTTAAAHYVKCREPVGYETTFAVCITIPLIQLPALWRLPKTMELEGEGQALATNQKEPADDPTQRYAVVTLCLVLQVLRSMSMASFEAALSELLYTEYHWNRRATGVVTAAMMFSMLPAQIVYERLALRFSVNRAIRSLLLVALVGSVLTFANDVFSLLMSALIVLPSLALSSGLIMGTMQIHCLPNSFVFNLTGCTLCSLLFSDFLGRGFGPEMARWSIAKGGQHAFGEQQLLLSSACVVLYEMVHVCATAKVNGHEKPEKSPPAIERTESGQSP